MSANLVLFLSSLIFSITTVGLVYKKWEKLDLYDIFVFMAGLYFGLWGLLSSYMNNLVNYRSWPVFWSLGIVLIPLVTTWCFLNLYLPKSRFKSCLQYIEMSTIQNIITKVRFFPMLLVTSFLAGFMIYSMEAYHITVNYSPDYLKENNIHLAVWYKAIYALYRPLLMVALLPVAFQIFNKRGYAFIGWCMLAVALFLLEGLFGRASFIISGLVFLMAYAVSRNKSMFSPKLIFFFALIFISAFYYSNFYQKIRSVLVLSNAYKIGQVDQDSYIRNIFFNNVKDVFVKRSFVGVVLSSSSTVSNLQNRPTEWDFNYLFLNEQIMNHRYNLTPNGKLFLAALKFSIPREIWKNKPAYLLQPLAFETYDLKYDYFRAPNLFGFIQADFGFLSLLISPIFMIFAIMASMLLLAKFKNDVGLFILIVGQALYFFTEIEVDYNGYLYFYRDLLLLAFIYVSIKLFINRMLKVAYVSFRSSYNF